MDQNYITVFSRGTHAILSLSNSFLESSVLISVPETNDQTVLKTEEIQSYTECILYHYE